MKLPGKKLKYAAIQHSIEYIKREFGIDIGEKERQQLVPEMMDTADLAIVIAERERWPGYLKEDDKVVFWDIPDPARMADGAADRCIKRCSVGWSSWLLRSGERSHYGAPLEEKADSPFTHKVVMHRVETDECAKRGGPMFEVAEAYEVMMGRWSRQLAPLFVEFVGVRDGEKVLDVGCGTGSLSATLARVTGASKIVGIDPSKVLSNMRERKLPIPG